VVAAPLFNDCLPSALPYKTDNKVLMTKGDCTAIKGLFTHGNRRKNFKNDKVAK
jgi:hypothetical protein